MSSSSLRESASVSIWIVTTPKFSRAVEVSFLTPSRPWMASSMRMQTASSTSSGAAPR